MSDYYPFLAEKVSKLNGLHPCGETRKLETGCIGNSLRPLRSDRKMERAMAGRMAIMRDLEYHRVAGTWKNAEGLAADR
jgi:hypothetical protein